MDDEEGEWMNIAQLHIYQQRGQISIKQDAGGVAIKQPQAKIQMRTEPLVVDIDRVERGLSIDQSKAWAAYGLMKTGELRSKIYSQVQNIAYQAIAKYAQDGDRLAAIHKPGDAIVELAKQANTDLIPIDYTGPARYDNVDVSYVPDELSTSFRGGEVHYHAQPQKPIIKRIPAYVEMGMKQYPSIRFEVRGANVNQYL